MARHEIVIHENTSATHDVAPYTGSYIAKETVALAEFAAAVGAKCGLPAIQVIAIIGGAFDAIAALEREALVRVHTDLGVVCGVIKGSFPSADAEFDPARNRLLLALRLDDSLRLDLADVTPTIITDASLNVLASKEVTVAFIAFGQNAHGIAKSLGINPKNTIEVGKDEHELRRVVNLVSKSAISASQKASSGVCQSTGFFEV